MSTEPSPSPACPVAAPLSDLPPVAASMRLRLLSTLPTAAVSWPPPSPLSHRRRRTGPMRSGRIWQAGG